MFWRWSRHARTVRPGPPSCDSEPRALFGTLKAWMDQRASRPLRSHLGNKCLSTKDRDRSPQRVKRESSAWKTRKPTHLLLLSALLAIPPSETPRPPSCGE